MIMLVLLLGAAGPACPAAPFDPFSSSAIEPRLGSLIPSDGPFLDQAGRRVALDDYLGQRPVILVPVDYGCTNICGVTLGGLFSALHDLDLAPDAYELVVVGIDPRDPVAQAREEREEGLRRLDREGAAERVHFLNGEKAASARLMEAVGFNYAFDPRTDQYAHPAAVAVLTPDARLARWLYGYPFEPADIRLALVEASDGAIGTLSDQVWLLCYGYDPRTGTYNALVGSLLRAGGGLTVIALLGLVAGMLWRERRNRQEPP
jgi:protein SCO1/2